MKARLTYNLKQQQQEAFDKEINRQMLVWMNNHKYDYERYVLWVLHNAFGFGEKRLKKAWQALVTSENELKKYYGDIATNDFLYEVELLNIGVDVEKWRMEME